MPLFCDTRNFYNRICFCFVVDSFLFKSKHTVKIFPITINICKF